MVPNAFYLKANKVKNGKGWVYRLAEEKYLQFSCASEVKKFVNIHYAVKEVA